jgi:hypothetical protein
LTTRDGLSSSVGTEVAAAAKELSDVANKEHATTVLSFM